MSKPIPTLSSADIESMLDNLNLDVPTRELLEQSLNCTLQLERESATTTDRDNEGLTSHQRQDRTLGAGAQAPKQWRVAVAITTARAAAGWMGAHAMQATGADGGSRAALNLYSALCFRSWLRGRRKRRIYASSSPANT